MKFGGGLDEGIEEERVGIWYNEKDLARVANAAGSANQSKELGEEGSAATKP